MSTAILVTGGAGYIGSHACKRLSAAGYTPVTLDNLSLGHEAFVRWGPLVRGDTHDSELVARTIVQHNIAAVMHFAAYAYVGESVEDPARYYHNNIGGTLGLLQGMRAAELDKLVFSSTCAVYGEPTAVPITERTSPMPVNPYGRTKLFCEAMIGDFAAAYGLNATALRYFNASGDDPDREIGERREIETHLIPRAIMAIQGHVNDFAVFGSDFPTADGTAVRDYIHVLDLAEAHVAALERLLGGAKGMDIYNLGTGVGHSVGEVLAMIRDVSGHSLPAPKGDRRPGDPACLVADPARANDVLGFAPRHSSLREIIETAWQWHQHAHPRRTAHAPID